MPDWPAFPDSHDALAALAGRYQLIILSNVDRDSFAASNRRLGVTFTSILTAQDIGSYKPSPGNFEALTAEARRLGVGQGRLLHVAQSLFHDHVPAKQAGPAYGVDQPPARPAGLGGDPRAPGGRHPGLGVPVDGGVRRRGRRRIGRIMTGQETASREAADRLARLGDEYFEVVHTDNPFNATQLGVSGFDALVPDPSRDGAAQTARRIAGIEQRLAGIDPDLLGDADRTSHAVLAHLAWAARSDLEHGLWEANASAGGYVSPQAMVFQSVPTALLDDAAAVRDYLQRLRRLGGYFDAATRRYRRPRRDGRVPTEVGTNQAIEQIEGHLARDIAADALVAVRLPGRRGPRRDPRRGRRDRRRRGPARDAAAAGLPAAGPAPGRPAG